MIAHPHSLQHPTPPCDILALLALSQAAALIDHIAVTGTINRRAMDHLLDCLLSGKHFSPDADMDCAMLGSYAQFSIGRRILEDYLKQELPGNQALIPGYIRAMVRLEAKLARRPSLQSRLHQRLLQAHQLQRFYATHPAAVYQAVAGAYDDTLGALNMPVPVTGALHQIVDRHNGNVIRTALLGGVQAARVWRHHGGRLRQLRWQRKGLLRRLKQPDFVAQDHSPG